MPRTNKRYPVEVRERAVRLVLEHEGQYETEDVPAGVELRWRPSGGESLRR